MVRRLLASVFLAAFPVVVIPIAVTSIGARAGASPPAPVQQCMNGGWRTFTTASGQPFENQGQCVAYAIRHPVSLADLASSSVSGTLSANIGALRCSFVEATFSAQYPGSSAVGGVTLQTEGCIPLGGGNFPFTFTYSGTFTITTAVGALTGPVAGVITNVILPPPPFGNVVPVAATLTLTATSGTGQFAGTTGTLNFGLQFPEPGSPAFVGSITPA
jgi:hypothetical protein